MYMCILEYLSMARVLSCVGKLALSQDEYIVRGSIAHTSFINFNQYDSKSGFAYCQIKPNKFGTLNI